MQHVHMVGRHSVVNITGLRASQRYLIVVESRSASGVTSARNCSLSVTTRAVDNTNVMSAVLETLVVVLAAVIVIGAGYSVCRYLHVFEDVPSLSDGLGPERHSSEDFGG